MDKQKILVIEDELEVAEIYKDLLVKAGFDVTIANSGNEGVSLAKQIKPQLIILDIMMPEMDGIEVLKRLKEDNETDLIPVIILTNVGVDHIQAEALSLGAVRYIVKTDVVYENFVEEVTNYINKDQR